MNNELRTLNANSRTINSLMKLSRLRRFVLLGIIILFLLQFVRIKIFVGGLSGSLAVGFVKLIDVFAYMESLIASKDFTSTALWAVIPVIVIYLIFGRAFCGWACPMDFLFELTDKIKNKSHTTRSRQMAESSCNPSTHKIVKENSILPKAGYGIAALLLIVSAILNIPFFTNYLSHLTNFFRLLTGTVFFALKLPFEPTVLAFSGGIIIFLLCLEILSPRLWCRVLCPIGKTYGLFNKVSLLRLKFTEGACSKCNLCEQMCYMDVKISKYSDMPELRDINCIYCGRCVEGCEMSSKIMKMTLTKN